MKMENNDGVRKEGYGRHNMKFILGEQNNI